MRPLIFVISIISVFLTACVSSSRPEQTAVSAVSPTPGPPPFACGEWPDGISFDIFPQAGRTLQLNGFGLKPEDRPILQIQAAGDESSELIEQQPDLTAAGSFQETITLPYYDYMRWHIRLLAGEQAACRYIIFGGDEWLETGVDTPAAHEDDPAVQDMMTGLGLNAAEARRRLQTEDAITELQARLKANEAATFAGLWLEHEPHYQVLVAFTRDGEATIEKYVAEDSVLRPFLELRPAQYTLAQLSADQEAAARLLQDMQQSAALYTAVQENQVVVEVTDRAAFDQALAASGTSLPQSVTVKTIYEPLGDNPPFAITPAPDVFMPQLKQRDVAFMEALLVGELVVENGCLRVKGDGEHYLVIWQADYYLHNHNGRLEILNETGHVVARVGETIYMGGGSQGAVNPAELREPIPEQCGGPYWRMGEFLPEEYIPQETTATPTPTPNPVGDRWQEYTLPDLNLSFSYPAGWYVHQAPKAAQISTSSQPTWSSIADPQQTGSGIHFDLLYNLNRQMGETPLAEIENMRQSFEEELEPISPAAPWPSNPDIVIGTYRFLDEQEGMVLLLGAAPNPLQDSPQPTIALTAVVKEETLDDSIPLFAHVLGSVHAPDGNPDLASSALMDMPALEGWTAYKNPRLRLALNYPPQWILEEYENSFRLIAPQTAALESGAAPWAIWVIEHEKYESGASLYIVIVNAYHFQGVINSFEKELTEEKINGRTAYRSTLIPAQGGQQSVFFEDDNRYIEVSLRPFNEDRPYEQQGIFNTIFNEVLESVTFGS